MEGGARIDDPTPFTARDQALWLACNFKGTMHNSARDAIRKQSSDGSLLQGSALNSPLVAASTSRHQHVEPGRHAQTATLLASCMVRLARG